jgi:hypothetical protein
MGMAGWITKAEGLKVLEADLQKVFSLCGAYYTAKTSSKQILTRK